MFFFSDLICKKRIKLGNFNDLRLVRKLVNLLNVFDVFSLVLGILRVIKK